MRVDELMLGDWVKIKPNPYMEDTELNHLGFDPVTHPYIITRVKQISEYGINPIERWGDTAYTLPIDIEGVELTPEILEKNGWILDDIDGSYRHLNNRFWIGGRNAPFGIMISNIYQEINYVHELQHALKSANIKINFIL